VSSWLVAGAFTVTANRVARPGNTPDRPHLTELGQRQGRCFVEAGRAHFHAVGNSVGAGEGYGAAAGGTEPGYRNRRIKREEG
jgi:hypothetical protein